MKNKYEKIIKEMTEKELLFHLYGTQIILLSISIILGVIIYKDLGFLVTLFNWQDRSNITIGILLGFIVVLLDLLLMKILPPTLYDDGGLNEKIFRNKNVIHIAFIAVVVAFSEELLFRGIIQAQLGLILTSFIFALIHYRYLFNWFLFINILILSFIIGFVYEWTENLSVTFIMHFIIDFLLGLFLMLKYKCSANKEVINRE